MYSGGMYFSTIFYMVTPLDFFFVIIFLLEIIAKYFSQNT